MKALSLLFAIYLTASCASIQSIPEVRAEILGRHQKPVGMDMHYFLDLKWTTWRLDEAGVLTPITRSEEVEVTQRVYVVSSGRAEVCLIPASHGIQTAWLCK